MLQRHFSKKTRQRNKRYNRRIARMVAAIDYTLNNMADDNPTGYLYGGLTDLWVQGLVSERDRVHALSR